MIFLKRNFPVKKWLKNPKKMRSFCPIFNFQFQYTQDKIWAWSTRSVVGWDTIWVCVCHCRVWGTVDQEKKEKTRTPATKSWRRRVRNNMVFSPASDAPITTLSSLLGRSSHSPSSSNDKKAFFFFFQFNKLDSMGEIASTVCPSAEGIEINVPL